MKCRCKFKRNPRRILDREVSPHEREAHDRVTREIITGILADSIWKDTSLTTAAERIMDLIRRRGYRAAITGVNRLEDGTYC